MTRPLLRVIKDGSTASNSVLTQRSLVRCVIIHDPLAPEGTGCIHIEQKPIPRSVFERRRGWCRVEADPPASRKICFDPGVGAARAHNIAFCQIVELSGPKTIYNSRWN